MVDFVYYLILVAMFTWAKSVNSSVTTSEY